MASKRLIKELDAYQKDPSPVVARLEPTSDDDILHLTAVLQGPDGTAYEGAFTPSTTEEIESVVLTMKFRRALETQHQYPTFIPEHTAGSPLPDTDLPSQRELQDGRDLPRPAKDKLDPCVWYREYLGGGTAAAECRRRTE